MAHSDANAGLRTNPAVARRLRQRQAGTMAALGADVSRSVRGCRQVLRFGFRRGILHPSAPKCTRRRTFTSTAQSAYVLHDIDCGCGHTTAGLRSVAIAMALVAFFGNILALPPGTRNLPVVSGSRVEAHSAGTRRACYTAKSRRWASF